MANDCLKTMHSARQDILSSLKMCNGLCLYKYPSLKEIELQLDINYQLKVQFYTYMP